MFKKRFLIISVALLVFSSAAVMADYNKEKVVSVMRENAALVGKVKNALKASDFREAEKSFSRFAEINTEIQMYTPPKGPKEEWEKTIAAFVDAAEQGAAASGKKDGEGANAAFQRLLALNKEGHKLFK